MFDQALCNAGSAGIACLALGIHTGADFVDEIYFNKNAWVIKGLGTFRGHNIPCRSPAFLLAERAVLSVIAPVMLGLFKGRVDYELVNTHLHLIGEEAFNRPQEIRQAFRDSFPYEG